MSVVFAASHPERVSALVLYGGYARGLWAPDYQFGVPERRRSRHLRLHRHGQDLAGMPGHPRSCRHGWRDWRWVPVPPAGSR
jgi:hypothetical protein